MIDTNQISFTCRINLYQLYNIPLPYLILTFMEKSLASLGQAYLNYEDSKGRKENLWNETFPLFECLNLLFNKFQRHYTESESHHSSTSEFFISKERIYRLMYSSFYLKDNVKSYLSNIQKAGYKKDIFKFIIPYSAKEKPKGMTEMQYSDYILGYKIFHECFEEFLSIEYYLP